MNSKHICAEINGDLNDSLGSEIEIFLKGVEMRDWP